MLGVGWFSGVVADVTTLLLFYVVELCLTTLRNLDTLCNFRGVHLARDQE
jgi:hypothetical protein